MGLSSVAFCFVLLATLLSSCSYFSEEKGKTEELPSVFFSNWDPTSTPVPPTPTPVPPTPTPVPPTSTPLPLKSVQSTSIDSGVQKALQSQGSESQFILDQSSIAMSDLRSYQFVLSGTALLDAGGLPMKVRLHRLVRFKTLKHHPILICRIPKSLTTPNKCGVHDQH